MKRSLTGILSRLYACLLMLYPPGFRRAFGLEMRRVFAQALSETAEAGPWRATVLFAREVGALPGSVAGAYLQEWRSMAPAPAAAPGLSWIAAWPLLMLAAVIGALLLSTPLGVALAALMGPAAGSATASAWQVDGTTVRMIGFLVALVMLGAMSPWLMLRRNLAHACWWIPVTVAGWLVSLALLWPAQQPLAHLDLLSPATILPILAILAVPAGLLQWRYLRRVAVGGGWWPLIVALSFAPIFVVQTLGAGIHSVYLTFLIWLVCGCGIWLLLGGARGRNLPARQP